MDKLRKQIADIIWVKTRKSDYGYINWVKYRILNPSQYVDDAWIIRVIRWDIEYIYELNNSFEYDITAVIKYILSKWYTCDIDSEWDSDILKVFVYKYEKYSCGCCGENETKGSFPLEFLYLYTDEEDKELLDLLHKTEAWF